MASGALSPFANNRSTVNADKLEAYLATIEEGDRKKLRYVLTAFVYDQDPVGSDLTAWKIAFPDVKNIPWNDRLSILLSSSPSYRRSHWWAESGARFEAFKTRYGGWNGQIIQLPLIVFRDIALIAKDLFGIVFASDLSLKAFKQYMEAPNLHNLSEMFNAGFTVAFFTSVIDTVSRVAVLNRTALNEIKDFLDHPSSKSLGKALQAYPGLLVGALIILTWVLVDGARFLIFNPSSMEKYKALMEERSLKNLKELILSNPGLFGRH